MPLPLPLPPLEGSSRITLGGSEVRIFRVHLEAGALLRVSARQEGVDVKLRLSDPEQGVRLQVDNLNDEHGQEPLFYLATRTGEHRVELEGLGRGYGSVTLDSEIDPHPAEAKRWAARASLLANEADLAVRCAGLGLYEEAIEAWRRAGEREAELLGELRWGFRLRLCGRTGEALRHLERARELRSAAGIEGGEPAILNALGEVYWSRGEGTKAREAFAGARQAARRLPEPREEAVALNGLALLSQAGGEIWEALVLFEQALAAFQAAGEREEEAAVLNNRGGLLAAVGKLPEARDSLSQALATFRQAGRKKDEAVTLQGLGWLHHREGGEENETEAQRLLEEALRLQREIGDRRGEAVTLDRLGSLMRETGRPRQALPYYRQALALFRAAGDRPSEAGTRSNLGGALALAGEAKAALREEDEALRLFREQGEPPSAGAFSRWRRAQALAQLGRLEEALGDSRQAILLLETIRTGAASDELRRDYLDSVHDLYELEVEVLMDLHARAPGAGWDARALEAAELSRARTLLDLIDATRQGGLGEKGAAFDRLRDLERQIRLVETEAQKPLPAPGRRQPGLGDAGPLRVLLEQREQVRIELRRRQGIRQSPPRLLSVPEIQRGLLDAQTVLVVFSLGERRSFAWALTPDRLSTAVLPPRSQLEELARRFHDLAARGVAGPELSQQEMTAETLSQLLLQPLASQLQRRRLAIVADGALAYVPFPLLPDPAAPKSLVLDRHEVVMLPSTSVLAALRRRATERRPAPRQLALLADPLFGPPGSPPGVAVPPPPGSDPALSTTLRELVRSSRDLGLEGLAPLPHSRREAEQILPMTRPGQSFSALGAEATLDLATSGRLAPYRTVHFATHALIHPTRPELSGLVLSLYDAAGRPRRGFLRSYEILDLHLPAELVVLSACSTGLGQELRGEGLVGLTQSFFRAGATRLLVSLWSVSDEATARLMTAFYQGLYRRRLPPAAALREAQLALRRDPRWSSPHFWAGFQLQGDWRPFD